MKTNVFVLLFLLSLLPNQTIAQGGLYTVKLRLSEMDTLLLGGKVSEWLVNVSVDLFDSASAYVPPSSEYLYNWHQNACDGSGYRLMFSVYGHWEEDWDGSFVKQRGDCCELCPYQTYNLYVDVVIDEVVYTSSPARLPDSGIMPVITFSLEQNYPNPFNPGTRIDFRLKEPGYVRLAVYDLLGRELALLSEGIQTAGNHFATWLPEKGESGVFVYSLTFVDGTGKRSTLARKMIMVK